MSSGSGKRSRISRLEMPPTMMGRFWLMIQESNTLLRVSMCLMAVIIMWAVTGAGRNPFSYQLGYTPARDISAQYEFKQFDEIQTSRAKDEAKRSATNVYQNNPGPLKQLLQELKNKVSILTVADPKKEKLPQHWEEFVVAPDEKTELTDDIKRQRFLEFQTALSDKATLETFKTGIDETFKNLIANGLLVSLDEHEGNQEKILVKLPQNKEASLVTVSDVLISNVLGDLKKTLATNLNSVILSQRIFTWLRPRLIKVKTLSWDKEATTEKRDIAVANVADINKIFHKGDLLAKAGKPLTINEIALLRLEYESVAAQPSFFDRCQRTMAILGMFVAFYTLCGFYIFFRNQILLTDLAQFALVLALVTLIVLICWFVHGDRQAEIIPLLLCGMIITIAFNQELALLISATTSLVVVFLLGLGISEFVVFSAASASAILWLRRIRSRKKLIYVGLVSGVVACLTSIGVHTLNGQPLEFPLIEKSMWYAIWVIITGFLMTGLLPFIEKLFSVQTDISLLEMGDVSHPLLQELIRRAPGTYNHSINVASIGEAAADAIGAHGLLVRVGAYFHDIGKMLKPGYFIENQQDGNRHEDLVPAMSTLIIIAHVKDGADLARQHRLPEQIIDFIRQHHGTTLVEYFYGRANEQSQNDPESGNVDESTFRYPGPKPQTKEAAVMMIADAVESASRALVEPGPSRIENLVREIANKRLLDGQFDECGLTLQELHSVQESLVKSLIAVYHGRIKYPDQKSAS